MPRVMLHAGEEGLSEVSTCAGEEACIGCYENQSTWFSLGCALLLPSSQDTQMPTARALTMVLNKMSSSVCTAPLLLGNCPRRYLGPRYPWPTQVQASIS